jgi:hypothetical protein
MSLPEFLNSLHVRHLYMPLLVRKCLQSRLFNRLRVHAASTSRDWAPGAVGITNTLSQSTYEDLKGHRGTGIRILPKQYARPMTDGTTIGYVFSCSPARLTDATDRQIDGNGYRDFFCCPKHHHHQSSSLSNHHCHHHKTIFKLSSLKIIFTINNHVIIVYLQSSNHHQSQITTICHHHQNITNTHHD